MVNLRNPRYYLLDHSVDFLPAPATASYNAGRSRGQLWCQPAAVVSGLYTPEARSTETVGVNACAAHPLITQVCFAKKVAVIVVQGSFPP